MNTQSNSPTLHARWARTPADMDQVFRLRYEGYLRKGAIDARTDERFSDHYDELPNQFSFLVESPVDGPLATVRISVVRPDLGWTAAPSARVFGDHAAFQEVARAPYVEASRLAFRHSARRDVLYRLLANMVALADLYEASWLVACPRVEHSHMYRRSFGFRQMAEPRQYFGVNFQTDLLGTPLDQIRAVAAASKPMRLALQEAALGLAARGMPQRYPRLLNLWGTAA